MNRFVALAILTAAFAPAAVMGALPIVISIVALLTTSWFLLAAWTDSTDSAAEPPVVPVTPVV